MAGSESYIRDDFWLKNLDIIPYITGSFVEDFASANLATRATQARGYNFYFACVVPENIHTHPAPALQRMEIILRPPSPQEFPSPEGLFYPPGFFLDEAFRTHTHTPLKFQF